MAKILQQVNIPDDLKSLNHKQLKELACDIRQMIIETVSQTGGHLGANLGVIELTIALHKVFNAPNDAIIWDVGHQCYPHKILTDRRELMHSLRQNDGISGFTKRSESPYDFFGAGHSSTSISAALGHSEAQRHLGKKSYSIAVIGDGAMTAGMAFEAMNHAGEMRSNLIVILNDNDMSIDPPTGALSKHLTKIVSSPTFKSIRGVGKQISQILPGGKKRGQFLDEMARDFIAGQEGTMFNALDFLYFGPIDGHNLHELTTVLENLKSASYQRPILLHVKTIKGKGYKPAEAASDRLHGVTCFDVETGKMYKSQSPDLSYTEIFGKTLTEIAQQDKKVIGITAAMPSGTGIKIMQSQLPKQTYDVGIAEQHAVTFAAGLAASGMKPFIAIYSTFLQRAWDQLVHDVALQNLPVRFMVDRAGFVGADGATHAGLFDLTMVAGQPNFVVMAPSCGGMLRDMIYTSYLIDDRPSLIRYPRGSSKDVDCLKGELQALPIGKGRIKRKGSTAAILSIGTALAEAKKAADLLAEKGYEITVADALFMAPLDEELITNLAKEHDILVTIEEGSIGGFGSIVAQYLLNQGLMDSGLKFRSFTAPNTPIAHADQATQRNKAKLDAQNLCDIVISLL